MNWTCYEYAWQNPEPWNALGYAIVSVLVAPLLVMTGLFVYGARKRKSALFLSGFGGGAILWAGVLSLRFVIPGCF